MTAAATKRKRVLWSLWRRDPNCHWCKEPTRFYQKLKHGGKIPDDAATADHVYPRGHPSRDLRGGRLFVVACAVCNALRNELERGMWKRPQEKTA